MSDGRLTLCLWSQGVVSTQLLEFTDVRYDVQSERSLALSNTGSVVAHFRFIPKLEDKSYCKVRVEGSCH